MRPQARISSDAGFERDVAHNYFEGNSNISESENSDQDEEDEPTVKKMRNLSEDQRQEEQLRIRKLHEDLAKIETDPRNPDHYERLLTYNPDSSIIWIRYMVCHVQVRDMEKAREIGKRALSTINSREEVERLLIWKELLSFEEQQGTNASFKKTLNEALRSNDEYKIYTTLLEMFAKPNCRLKGLDEIIAKINKKFSDSIDAYLQCATVYFKRKQSDKARLILQKALSKLPTKSHVTMISEFALMENSDGSPEEAQTLFEHVLTCFPSRIDMWSLYVDMLAKSNKIDLARQAFERALTLPQLSPKRRTSMFTNWGLFEMKYGTPESLKKVEDLVNNS